MNRINQPILAPTAPRIDFGLIAWLEETRTRLPLKGVDCRFDVSGDLVSVEIDQVFHQINSVPVNCTYTFPLPGNAAVYRCEIQIGSRTIRARVEEQEKARELFREKVAAGHRAGLVETERENLFTLSLGNIQPNDRIIVKLAYFQTVDRTADDLSLLIPFCPGVRYIPGQPLWRESKGKGTVPDTDQVPDASRISPPRIDATHEDAAFVSIEGRLDSSLIDAASVASPLHKIDTSSEGERLLIKLQFDADVPDRDFVVRWREKSQANTVAMGWAYEAEGHTYALVQLKAPEHVNVAEDYEQDNYFLIDRSGSMQGEKWLKTAEALKQFVRQLGKKDRVWLTFFETRFVDFAERLMSPAELLKDQSFNTIEERGTGGGTEMLPALRHVLEKVTKFSAKAQRAANVIIITDGQIGNEMSILEALRRYQHVRVFTFGIDVNVNDAFLRDLARRHCGTAVFRTPREDISGAVAALGAKLRKPVLTDLKVTDSWEPARANIPDVFENDLLIVPFRCETNGRRIEFAASLPDGQKHSIVIEPKSSSNPAIKLLWAKERIQKLLDDQKQSKAIRLAIANNIICKGAAFIAWDEQEKVPVAQKEIYQPSLQQFQTAHFSMRKVAVAGSSAALRARASLDAFADEDHYVGCIMDGPPNALFSRDPLVAGLREVAPVLGVLASLGEAGERLLEALRRWANSDTARLAALKKLEVRLVNAKPDQWKEICVRFIREQLVAHNKGLSASERTEAKELLRLAEAL